MKQHATLHASCRNADKTNLLLICTQLKSDFKDLSMQRVSLPSFCALGTRQLWRPKEIQSDAMAENHRKKRISWCMTLANSKKGHRSSPNACVQGVQLLAWLARLPRGLTGQCSRKRSSSYSNNAHPNLE